MDVAIPDESGVPCRKMLYRRKRTPPGTEASSAKLARLHHSCMLYKRLAWFQGKLKVPLDGGWKEIKIRDRK